MSDDRARRLAQLRQAYESGILDQDTYRAAVAALAEPPGATAEVIGSGATAQQGGVAAGAGGVAVGGNVYGSIYTGPPPKDAAEALAIYRRVTAQTCGQLPLRSVDVGASDPTTGYKPLGLANVYVDLDTTAQVEVASEETAQRKRERQGAMLDERESRPLGALEAAIANRHMVLLGDPGGGKSTFVNHIAFCLAMHTLEPTAKWLDHLPGWPAHEAGALPVVVLLRDFARGLPERLPRAEPRHLWDFISQRLQAQNLSFAADSIHDALERGKALVLLDGLDEVQTVEQRAIVRDAVIAFIGRYPRARFLVTCRVLSYQPPARRGDPDSAALPSVAGQDLRLPQIPTFELAPFDEDKISRFVVAWYDELARIGLVRSQDKDSLARQLQEAVCRPDLWRLAPNPLLLTVMALVHTHKGRLPDARAMLYEETIDILLWRWEQVKAGGGEETPRLRQLLLEANRTEVDLKRTLWQLAYQVHAQGGAGDDQDKLADISEWRLEKALAALNGDDRNWARQVIEAMKLRAGLLLERAPEVFTFPHRTFQEYLAGAHLAAQANFAREARTLAEQAAQWREAILLAVGRLVYLAGDTDKPLALAGELCPAQASDDDAGWRKAWLAGDTLLEIGVSRLGDSALGRDLLARAQNRLVSLLAGGKLSPRERAAAGNTLAHLGDPRFRADAWSLPDEPLLGFVEISAGPFAMGTRNEDIPSLMKRFGGGLELYERETPQHQLDLPGYYLSRYPVTVAQFRAFVEASGYTPRVEDSLRGLPNHPVVRVTWHDAIAYCDWLTETLTQWDRTPEPLAALLRKNRWRITLPSEAEWEKASRGPSTGTGDGRIFPWGNDLDPNRANYDESKVDTTSPVGAFPGGVCPYGVLDLSGNVWEWTRSLWGEDWETLFRYPYDPGDRRRENLKAPDRSPRVVRGGAFFNNQRNVRCVVRVGYLPNYRVTFIGFRVVASPCAA